MGSPQPEHALENGQMEGSGINIRMYLCCSPSTSQLRRRPAREHSLFRALSCAPNRYKRRAPHSELWLGETGGVGGVVSGAHEIFGALPFFNMGLFFRIDQGAVLFVPECKAHTTERKKLSHCRPRPPL